MARILIIEDDRDIAEIERDYLELGGFSVTICADGNSGLAEALTGQYDLVLLDLMLRGGRMWTRFARLVLVLTTMWKSRFRPAFWSRASRRTWLGWSAFAFGRPRKRRSWFSVPFL